MTLRYDQVADLIKIIDASACDELVLETAELKLSIRRHAAGEPNAAAATAPRLPSAAPQAGSAKPALSAAPRVETPPPSAGTSEVRAPMVGTFYRSPSPDAPPFVDIGSKVEIGQPLCIIEVMKLFTTLYAEFAGTIREINAANGELVEYDRVLFAVEV
jgi:acetyl-CoA carboxylase biotin carboxyl carrier protein